MPISTTTQYELALALRAALDDVEGGSAAPYERFRSLASHAGMLIAEGNVLAINRVAARAMTSAWRARQSPEKLLDLLIVVGLAHRHGFCPEPLGPALTTGQRALCTVADERSR